MLDARTDYAPRPGPPSLRDNKPSCRATRQTQPISTKGVTSQSALRQHIGPCRKSVTSKQPCQRSAPPRRKPSLNKPRQTACLQNHRWPPGLHDHAGHLPFSPGRQCYSGRDTSLTKVRDHGGIMGGMSSGHAWVRQPKHRRDTNIFATHLLHRRPREHPSGRHAPLAKSPRHAARQCGTPARRHEPPRVPAATGPSLRSPSHQHIRPRVPACVAAAPATHPGSAPSPRSGQSAPQAGQSPEPGSRAPPKMTQPKRHTHPRPPAPADTTRTPAVPAAPPATGTR